MIISKWVFLGQSHCNFEFAKEKKLKKKNREASKAASSCSWDILSPKKKTTPPKRWAWTLATEKLLLRKESWDPCRDRTRTPLRPGEAGSGTRVGSGKRWGLCTWFCFLQHKPQNVPLERPKGVPVRHSVAAFFPSWSTASESASELLFV